MINFETKKEECVKNIAKEENNKAIILSKNITINQNNDTNGQPNNNQVRRGIY